MALDRLDALLRRFSLSARMFHSGPLCGVHDFSLRDDLGQLHLVRGGALQVWHPDGLHATLDRPSLVFYPRPHWHRFRTDPVHGADMACAYVAFQAGSANPLAQALPAVLILPLDELDGAQAALDLLFTEAFGQQCGRQQLIDRLFEVVLILLLRRALSLGRMDPGLLAGLADPRLAKALVAIHEGPEQAWTLASLAERANMSRSHFASVFGKVLGLSPGDYLMRHRIAVAQHMLRAGRPLIQVADAVGYGSSAALSRAFSAVCGQSPRAWLQAQA